MSQGASGIADPPDVATDVLEVLVEPEARLVLAVPDEVGVPDPDAVMPPPVSVDVALVAVELFPPPPTEVVAPPELLLSPPLFPAVVLEPAVPPLPCGPAENEPHAMAAAPTDRARGSSVRG
jgi:hypothetical protein